MVWWIFEWLRLKELVGLSRWTPSAVQGDHASRIFSIRFYVFNLFFSFSSFLNIFLVFEWL